MFLRLCPYSRIVGNKDEKPQNYEVVILQSSPDEFMREVLPEENLWFGFFVLPFFLMRIYVKVFSCSLSWFPLPKGSFEAHQAALSHLVFAVT